MPELDRTIGKFQLIRPLGAGGMGQVYLARQQKLDRLVAIKVLHKDMADDTVFLERFRREARAAAVFQHPNIVAVITADVDEASGEEFIAFEFVDGPSLEDRVKADGRMPEGMALEIVRDVAEALTYAEAKGIVHRDIKPDNILIGTDGVTKLADLGLAKTFDHRGHASVTQTGVIVGTPLYMAPEQALGYESVDVRADIYALGLVLWRMLTGLVPFDEDGTSTSLHILSRHINEDVPDVRTRNPEVSEETAGLLRGMCARERDDRYRSAGQLLADVERLLDRQPLAGPGGEGDPHRTATLSQMTAKTLIQQPPGTTRRRRRSSGGWESTAPAWTPEEPASASGPPLRLVAGLAVAGLLVAGAYFGWSSGESTPSPPAVDGGDSLPLPPTGEPHDGSDGATSQAVTPPEPTRIAPPDLDDEAALLAHIEATSLHLFTDVELGRAHVDSFKLATGWEDAEPVRLLVQGFDGVLRYLDLGADPEDREAGKARLREIVEEQRKNIIPGKVAAAVDRELGLWDRYLGGIERLERALSDPRATKPAQDALSGFAKDRGVEAQAAAVLELADTVDFHTRWVRQSGQRKKVAQRLGILTKRLAGTATGTALRYEVLAMASLIKQLLNDTERSLLTAVYVVAEKTEHGPQSRFVAARQTVVPSNASLSNMTARGLVLELSEPLREGQEVRVEVGKAKLRFTPSAFGKTPVQWGLKPRILLEPRSEDVLVRLPGAQPGEFRHEVSPGTTRFKVVTREVALERVVLIKLPPRE